jgi:predicted DNA-binding transcriptional regulator YafY
MRVNRLLEITLRLLNKDTVTARELSERFGVSTRTIYRDIDELSAAGVPVFTNKGSGGGISLLDGFTINRAALTAREREGLLLALKTLQAAKYPQMDAALEKIGAIFRKAGETDWVRVEFTPWGAGPSEEDKFGDVKRAILECRVLVLDYINADGVLSHRSVEPMRLVFKTQAWYMWAYCRASRSFRSFRISRIRTMTVTNESFVRRPLEEFNDEKLETATLPTVTLTLRFQPEHLFRVYDDYHGERITRVADRTYDVTLTLPEDASLYGYIMSFGDCVQVLGPPHVRRHIRQRLQKALDHYRR